MYYAFCRWTELAHSGFQSTVFDGTDKLLTFQFSKDREFHGAVIVFFATLRVVEVADVVAQNVAVGDVAPSRFCKGGYLLS